MDGQPYKVILTRIQSVEVIATGPDEAAQMALDGQGEIKTDATKAHIAAGSPSIGKWPNGTVLHKDHLAEPVSAQEWSS